MEEMLQVGVITSPHGVRGEAKVYPTTDDKERFRDLKEVYLDTGKGMRLLHVISVKFFKNMAILGFEEFSAPEEIDLVRRKGLYVTRDQAVPLEEDEYYIADLIGIEVFTEAGERFGVLKDVLSTGANDVYVIESAEHGEVLLPAIADCIRRVDVSGRRMEVHLMSGLLD